MKAKGSEKYQAQGRGNTFQSDYNSANPLKKGTRESKSKLGGMAMGGNERGNGHARTSFAGAVVSGKHQAAK